MTSADTLTFLSSTTPPHTLTSPFFTPTTLLTSSHSHLLILLTLSHRHLATPPLSHSLTPSHIYSSFSPSHTITSSLLHSFTPSHPHLLILLTLSHRHLVTPPLSHSVTPTYSHCHTTPFVPPRPSHPHHGNGLGGGTLSLSTSRLASSAKNFLSKQLSTLSASRREPVMRNVAGRGSRRVAMNWGQSSGGTIPRPC